MGKSKEIISDVTKYMTLTWEKMMCYQTYEFVQRFEFEQPLLTTKLTIMYNLLHFCSLPNLIP